MKNKYIAIIQKQILMKIIIWWRASYKTLTRIWNLSWNGFGESITKILKTEHLQATSWASPFEELLALTY